MNESTRNQFTGTRDVILFLIIFLAVSAALYLLHIFFGDFYIYITGYGAKPLLALFGYEMDTDRLLLIKDEISLNLIVFLSLVISTWRISILKRLKAAGWGILILTAANSIIAFLTFLSAKRGSESLWTGTEFLNLTINFFLALLLWFLLLPIKSHFPYRKNSK